MTQSSFFASFANFQPDPTALLTEEFARLAVQRHWQPGSKRYRKNQRRCYIEEFNTHWGGDVTRLELWQALSREVGIDPIPTSITQCKKALKKTHVNIVDLIDCRRAGTAVRKVFAKEAAKQEGFIKVLLREIF